jgi:hypothetical protein
MNSVTPYPWFFVTEVGESEACPVVLREEFVTFSKSASALRGVVFLVRKTFCSAQSALLGWAMRGTL